MLHRLTPSWSHRRPDRMDTSRHARPVETEAGFSSGQEHRAVTSSRDAVGLGGEQHPLRRGHGARGPRASVSAASTASSRSRALAGADGCCHERLEQARVVPCAGASAPPAACDDTAVTSSARPGRRDRSSIAAMAAPSSLRDRAPRQARAAPQQASFAVESAGVPLAVRRLTASASWREASEAGLTTSPVGGVTALSSTAPASEAERRSSERKDDVAVPRVTDVDPRNTRRVYADVPQGRRRVHSPLWPSARAFRGVGHRSREAHVGFRHGRGLPRGRGGVDLEVSQRAQVATRVSIAMSLRPSDQHLSSRRHRPLRAGARLPHEHRHGREPAAKDALGCQSLSHAAPAKSRRGE